jgi:hypothetical protein
MAVRILANYATVNTGLMVGVGMFGTLINLVPAVDRFLIHTLELAERQINFTTAGTLPTRLCFPEADKAEEATPTPKIFIVSFPPFPSTL